MLWQSSAAGSTVDMRARHYRRQYNVYAVARQYRTAIYLLLALPSNCEWGIASAFSVTLM
jgi:hypothetical protein